MNETEICRTTLYKYLSRPYDQELIGKKTNTNLYKNGARFMLFPSRNHSSFCKNSSSQF